MASPNTQGYCLQSQYNSNGIAEKKIRKNKANENMYLIKDQLISECLLGVIDFPKNQQKIWQISALESKKWSNQQSKSIFIQ